MLAGLLVVGWLIVVGFFRACILRERKEIENRLENVGGYSLGSAYYSDTSNNTIAFNFEDRNVIFIYKDVSSDYDSPVSMDFISDISLERIGNGLFNSFLVIKMRINDAAEMKISGIAGGCYESLKEDIDRARSLRKLS